MPRAGSAPGTDIAPHYDQLVYLIQKNDIAGARALLEAGADPNAVPRPQPAPMGLTTIPLRAGPNGQLGVPSVKLKLEMHRPVLFCAASEGSPSMLALLLSQGADAKKTMRDGTTALHALVNACPNRFSSKPPSADWAQAIEDKVALLVAAGTPVNACAGKSKGKVTALHEALSLQRDPVVALSLLRHGADPTQKRYADDALQLATCYIQVEVMEALIKGGMDPAEVGPQGHTLLHRLASTRFQEKIVSTLPPANPFVPQAYRDAIDLLLRHGVDLEARTPSGNTALHMAAEQGHAGAVQALIEAGANIQATNNARETPIMLADGREGGPGEAGAVLRAALARQTLAALHANLSPGLTPRS